MVKAIIFKIVFVLANSFDADEMLHYMVFIFGYLLFVKYALWSHQYRRDVPFVKFFKMYMN